MKKTTVFCDVCKQEITKLGKEFEIIATDSEDRKNFGRDFYPTRMCLEICAPCTEIIKEGGTLYFDVTGKKPPQII